MARSGTPIFSFSPVPPRPGLPQTCFPLRSRSHICQNNSYASDPHDSSQFLCWDGNKKRFHPGKTEQWGTKVYPFSLLSFWHIHLSPSRFSILADIFTFPGHVADCFDLHNAVIERRWFLARGPSESREIGSKKQGRSSVLVNGY